MRAFKRTDSLNEEQRSFLKSITFADDKYHAGLQAADFLAYEVREFHMGQKRKASSVLDGKPGAHSHFDRKAIRKLAKSIPAKFGA